MFKVGVVYTISTVDRKRDISAANRLLANFFTCLELHFSPLLICITELKSQSTLKFINRANSLKGFL